MFPNQNHLHPFWNTNLKQEGPEGPGSLTWGKGHSGANNREPQGHNLNNFGRGPLDDAIYQIWKLWAL